MKSVRELCVLRREMGESSTSQCVDVFVIRADKEHSVSFVGHTPSCYNLSVATILNVLFTDVAHIVYTASQKLVRSGFFR
jgi:hypothetical protein